jgi:6-phosphogluconolactonase
MNDLAAEIIVKPEAELYEAAARRLIAAVGEPLEKKPVSRVCLSGGSTPEPLYRILAGEDFARRIAWERVHFFWSDERCVPSDHELSNYRMAREALLSHLDLVPGQVHRIECEGLSPEAAAGRYESTLALHFGLAGPKRSGEVPRFDLILLGIGADGHTASLFPHDGALSVDDRWSVAVERPDAARVTLTLPVLNAAHQIHFLAVGAEKAHSVSKAVRGIGEPEGCPAGLVKPRDGRLYWLLDTEAAAGLTPQGSMTRTGS